jgi:spore maturation protein CgeB
MNEKADVIIIGLSITSSWGNGHATTFRGLVRGLAARGHRVLFFERNMPWYAANRDEPHPAGAQTVLYESLDDLHHFDKQVSEAKLVIVGSFVPEGRKVGEWVTSVAKGLKAFYDIDTPVTLSQLSSGTCEYISPELIPKYDFYLSFTGGPTLRMLEGRYGAPMARVFYCSVDSDLYEPCERRILWDLGYLGTYSEDRQATLDELLLEPARRWSSGRFAVSGPKYPPHARWPPNVNHQTHLSPAEHPRFYSSQRFTLNVTRKVMIQHGYSPSVRLFEAGGCGTPVISDWWEGLDTLFRLNQEILISESADQTLRYLRDLSNDERLRIGAAARQRILSEHTPLQRAIQLEEYMKECHDNVLTHTPRRDGRGWQVLSRMGSGLVSQSNRTTAGSAVGKAAIESADRRDLQQPAGARD